jgi:uncharacterized protein
VRLRVSPGARHAGVVGRHGDGWRVRVAAPPERGRANEAVVHLLASTLSLSHAAVTVVSGHRSRDKLVELAGIDSARTDERLSAAAGKGHERG